MRKIKFEYKITAAYAIIGGIWILFSDNLLFYFIGDLDLLNRAQTYKGWFYVIITAILLYLFLKKHLVKIRDAEKKAKESERLKTVFLQNISHEIRTPMNGIIGFAELLNNEGLTGKQKKQYLEIIINSTNQLLQIVNDVIDISLIETGSNDVHEEKLHLNDFLDELYLLSRPLINEEISFTLTKGLPDELSIILTDKTKISQILNNLLINAIKFTEKGFIKFGYVLNNGMLEFFVEDTGIGIAPSLQNEIFEPFHKADIGISKLYQGVGLGLAICKGYADLLKCKIWVESELNKGSVFFVSMPYKHLEKALI